MKIISRISNIQLHRITMTLKLKIKTLLLVVFALTAIQLIAQEEVETNTEEEAVTNTESKPVRDMFESTWLIDNQSVIVPKKGTFQTDIIHRFGVVNNGYEDLYGIFAPSNIKLGFAYSILDNLSLGFGITKTNMTWDLNAKYAILQQTRSGSIPLSITYFGNIAIDSRDADHFINSSDRLSFFHQLIFARKVSNRFSFQVAPSLSHYNAVEAFINTDKEKVAIMENDHFAISTSGRFKVADQFALIANYDQPITKHFSNNPNPNISFGIEMSTSSHTFQVFVGNYNKIIPQRNNVFNQNDFKNGDFLIGFNITRLWNW
jgi:Membrane bound beta barrel domain (DUF5777)